MPAFAWEAVNPAAGRGSRFPPGQAYPASFDPTPMEYGPGAKAINVFDTQLDGGGGNWVRISDASGAGDAYISGARSVSLGNNIGGTGFTSGPSGNVIGFFNGGPAAKQTPAGSRGGNAALASLLTALAAYGLITDGTSA